MMCMYLSMLTHTHINSWKLNPGLILLAKVCPWWGPTDSQTSNVIAKVANGQYIIYTMVTHLLECFYLQKLVGCNF
jgi:hypothetical protein